LTVDQAQAIIDERANGGWEVVKGTLSPTGEWCLAELEALTIRRRTDEQFPFKDYKLPERDGVSVYQDPLFGYDTDLRDGLIIQFMGENRPATSPCLDGASASKGGRAWLSGHWGTCDLEALCAHLRRLAGDHAVGAVETLAGTLHSSVDSASINPHVPPLTVQHYTKMLYAGINPATFPRVWQMFIDNTNRGFSLPRVVCAANEIVYLDAAGQRIKLLVAGARHCDRVMGDVTYALQARHGTIPGYQPFVTEDQGFIDQFGIYWTREEAWTIAEYQGQIVKRMGWLTGRLHSENLY
jgi:hypothetical protein